MGEAWERLMQGTYVQSDLALLQHEFAEFLLMRGKAIEARDAHNLVNRFFNWEKTV